MRKTTRKMWAAAAGVTGIALLATACSSSSSPAGSSTTASNEKVTLTVATFNEFGYSDLYKEYMQLHPNVTIEGKKAATSNDARTALTTALSAGAGASDIEAADVDWMPELIQSADAFANLTSDSVKDRWPTWKSGQATTTAGKLIGYGTDSGPEAICYRSDLFAAKGLPTARADVEKLFSSNGGGWDQYFKVADQYGPGFFDSAAAIFQGMINQIAAPYEDASTGKITVTTGDGGAVKTAYDQILAHDADSAHLTEWSDDWTASFQKGAFATMLCPSWMTQIIAGDAKGVAGWDIANVYPGGGGNWGGSFLLVPAQGKHIAAATALADWLTAPAQAAKVFSAFGNFPSQTDALKDPLVTGKTDTFFNNAPTGATFIDRFNAIKSSPFKGSHYFAINDAMAQALGRVDVDKTDKADASWSKFQDAVKQLS